MIVRGRFMIARMYGFAGEPTGIFDTHADWHGQPEPAYMLGGPDRRKAVASALTLNDHVKDWVAHLDSLTGR